MVLPRLTPSWWGSTAPTVGPTGTATTWVAARYVFNAPGRIFGVRFWDAFGSGPAGVLVGIFSDVSSQEWFDAGVYFKPSGLILPSGWKNIWLRPAKRVDTADIYTVCALYRGGGFFRTNNAVPVLGTPVFHGHIGLRSSFQSTNLDPGNTSFAENLNANAVDVLFQAD